jgi:hypothetical protein
MHLGLRMRDFFHNREITQKIQNKLPELFHIAELESSRAGKIGMEVGSVREKILIALLISYYGQQNVSTDLSIHEPEIDVVVRGVPVSIKTITGLRLMGVKVIWTVDREQVLMFRESYQPHCDMLYTHINWDGDGGLYYFDQELQLSMLNRLGRESYLKLPRPGTNPRGVEISTQAVRELARHPRSMKIPLKWVKKEIKFDPYKRWLEHWEQE